MSTTGGRRTRRSRAEDRAPGATIEEVARLAGVSRATVSRALRRLPNVAAETRQRVEAAADELDYHIDRTASRLATGRTETVAVVVPTLSTWYFGQVLGGIEATLADRGLDVLVTSVHAPAARHRLASSAAPLHKRVDGLIFVDVLLTPDEVAALEQSTLHVVTVGQRTGRFPSVTLENRLASRSATQHLLNLGHRDIAFVAGDLSSGLHFAVPGDRRDGYADALAGAGIERRPELELETGSTVEHGAQAAARLLSTARPPTAVVAASDDLAFGALRTLRDLGYAVPGDVSIVGFDDRELSAAVGLTTVRHDPTEQGHLAAGLLADAATGAIGPGPHDVVAETRLVVRSTTSRPDAGPATEPPTP